MTEKNVPYVAPDINGALRKVEGDLVDVVEKKVNAAGTGALISSAIVSVIGLYVLHGTVPDWLTAIIEVVVTTAITWASAFLAKHTSRVVTPPVIDPLDGTDGSHRAG